MVDSFEINREKTSNNRYLASVNVTFNERAIQSFLAQNTNMAINDSYYQQNPNAAYNQGQFDNRLISPQARMNNAIPTSQLPLSEYRMQVNINNLREWARIRKSLEAIGDIELSRLNTRMAVVTLRFPGQPETLQSTLNQKGLQLYNNEFSSETPYILMQRG
jgi:hypothetical protein